MTHSKPLLNTGFEVDMPDFFEAFCGRWHISKPEMKAFLFSQKRNGNIRLFFHSGTGAKILILQSCDASKFRKTPESAAARQRGAAIASDKTSLEAKV